MRNDCFTLFLWHMGLRVDRRWRCCYDLLHEEEKLFMLQYKLFPVVYIIIVTII
jgi:hypothetical protein